MNKTILITGASGAIGGALARHYAHADVHLILHGRNGEALADIAAQCRQLGATVSSVNLELRDTAALQTWASELAAQQLPDLIIANAGMNNAIGANGYEDWADVAAVLDLNIKATFALINALLPALVARGSGQIALISSLAAWYGLPITPSYCASKAAMKVYGEALRGGLSSKGLRVNVVLAGYVQSPMCEAMPGPKPFLWSADKAARYIARGLARNQARISFPFPLNLGTWFLAVLPAPVSQWLLQFLHYGADEC